MHLVPRVRYVCVYKACVRKTGLVKLQGSMVVGVMRLHVPNRHVARIPRRWKFQMLMWITFGVWQTEAVEAFRVKERVGKAVHRLTHVTHRRRTRHRGAQQGTHTCAPMPLNTNRSRTSWGATLMTTWGSTLWTWSVAWAKPARSCGNSSPPRCVHGSETFSSSASHLFVGLYTA
jgi:hypothetical protein